jgi:membrane protease YdiL (CAAX protease family)
MLPTPTGWFPDPWNDAGVRYWDGRAWTGLVAPASQEPQPHPVLPIKAAWGAVGILLVSVIASRYLLKAIAGFHWPIAAYVAILGVAGYAPSMLWCGYASRRWGTGRFRADVGLQARWVDAGWGPVIWIASLVAQIVVGVLVLALKIPFISNTRDISELSADRGYVVSTLILAVVAAPVIEEIVFRGVVLRGLLSRYKAPLAVGLQGGLFGLAHFDPIRGAGNIGLLLVLTVVGVVLGGAAYLLRRLAPTMIAHAILNGLAMALALSGWMPKT